MYIDIKAFVNKLREANRLYRFRAPLVAEHVMDLEIRLATDYGKVTVAEMVSVLQLWDGSGDEYGSSDRLLGWLVPMTATEHVKALRDRLGIVVEDCACSACEA